ncbi:MAG: V4R domain-containing protein [Symbiobacterium sp.]|uniref:V4R domain-containing protein n=1 Tax=Symbiobacterium sp. TaxID=1971213 RepID=UPI00346401E1
MPNSKDGFSWDQIGDIALGRPNLGPTTRLEAYRLMQFSLRHVLEAEYGAEAADRLFRAAGRLAGQAFAERQMEPRGSLPEYVRDLQRLLREFGIGILRVEETNPDAGRLVLTVAEDLDCSGLPEMNMHVCKYDEGFIAGLLEAFTGRIYHVTEVDCWASGERVCRFVAEAEEPQ